MRGFRIFEQVLTARLAFVFQQPGTRFVVLAATTLRAVFRFGLLIAQIRDKCHRVRALQNIQSKIDIVFLFGCQHTQKILANDGSIGNTDLMVAPNFTQRMNAGISQAIDLGHPSDYRGVGLHRLLDSPGLFGIECFIQVSF